MTKPKYPSFAGTERELLEAHLEHNRLAIRHKVEGLWFCRIFNGEDWIGSSTDENPDGEFDIGLDETVESWLNEYDRACARSREICEEYGLDDVSSLPNSRNDYPSLRWVYLHMVEEIARHAGHLDIYRELIDATTDRD